MKVKALLAALVAVVVAGGVVASTSSAVPYSGLAIASATAVPTTQVPFGTVPIGKQVVRPVLILNRTNEWMHYGGATWPNLQYPGAGAQPYPQGFWNVSGSGYEFPCWDVAPKGHCTLKFGWQPFETGAHTATFMMWYQGAVSGNTYSSNTVTMSGGGY